MCLLCVRMCMYTYYIYARACLCMRVAFLIFHVRAPRWMKHPKRILQSCTKLRRTFRFPSCKISAKISSISWRGTRSRIKCHLPSRPFAHPHSYLHCIPKNARLAHTYCVSRWILTCGNDGYRYVSVRSDRNSGIGRWRRSGRAAGDLRPMILYGFISIRLSFGA